MKSKNLATKNTRANEKKQIFRLQTANRRFPLKMTLFEKTVAVEKIKR
jgi:hypothetical protein